MSLGGRLSDFSLPDLLQVVALSRKTGSLEICAEHGGVAWLGVRDGRIVRVALDGGSLDRDQVLEKHGVTGTEPSERVEAILWDAALEALLALFEWREGDFTFEPCADPATAWRGPAGILLSTPVSPEYLALEGARLADESDLPSLPSLRSGGRPTASGAAAARPPAPAKPAAPRVVPVICVDRDLRLLEQIKSALGGGPDPVHIFQDSASALQRLKQYVLRGELPVLILGTDLEDPLDSRRGLGWKRFAERVRALAPRVRIAVLAEQPREPPPGIAWLMRPPAGRATPADMSAFVQTLRGAIGGDP